MRAFARFMALFAVGLAAIAAFTYPAWRVLHPHADFPFHRIGERIGMLALLIGLVLAARPMGLADRASLGYGLPRRVFAREMALGLLIGAASMAAAVGLMDALGLLAWNSAGFGGPGIAKLVLARLASGIAVAFIEETFLRGAMHTAIERESGATAAVLLTAVVYSATHFFASFRIPAALVRPDSGLDLLAGTLHLFARPLTIADAFACLTAVGVVLGAVRVATGNIAACIGLHAGWVWVMLVVHALAQPVRTLPWSWLLSGFDGFVGWLLFGWTLLVGAAIWRIYRRPRYASGASASSR